MTSSVHIMSMRMRFCLPQHTYTVDHTSLNTLSLHPVTWQAFVFVLVYCSTIFSVSYVAVGKSCNPARPRTWVRMLSPLSWGARSRCRCQLRVSPPCSPMTSFLFYSDSAGTRTDSSMLSLLERRTPAGNSQAQGNSRSNQVSPKHATRLVSLNPNR